MKMDYFRSDKPYNFVSVEKNLKEAVRKDDILRLNWFERFSWIVNEYKVIQEKLRNLNNEKHAKMGIQIEKDKRSCLPAPETTSGMYGWLESKKEFCLENPRNYITKYRNPMDDIFLLKGDVPRIAAGIGFY